MLRGIFSTQASICDGAFRENTSQLTILVIKDQSQIFAWVPNRPSKILKFPK